jgi:hypothetical protein
MLGRADGTRQCDGEIEASSVSNPIFVNGQVLQGAMARRPLGEEVVRTSAGTRVLHFREIQRSRFQRWNRFCVGDRFSWNSPAADLGVRFLQVEGSTPD